MKNYNDRIRELREDHDLTQTQVAAVLGIDQRTYSNYELGYRALPIEHLIRLCKYSKLSADFVLGIKLTKAARRRLFLRGGGLDAAGASPRPTGLCGFFANR